MTLMLPSTDMYTKAIRSVIETLQVYVALYHTLFISVHLYIKI